MGKKKQSKKTKEKVKEKTTPTEKNQEENPFDFGGIPDRNLKKNLGCG